MSSTRWPLRAALACVVAGAFSSGPTLADPAPAYAELLRRAQSAAPRLAESRAHVAQSEGLARQAAARPNPTLSLEVENFAGQGPFKGGDAAESTASVQQALELGGKRPARIAAGRAELEVARARAAMVDAAFAFDLAQAYAGAEAADLRFRLAGDAITLAEEDLRVTRALVEAGKEAELRVLQARSAVETARAQLGEAQAEREGAFARLTALTGDDPPITTIAVSLLAHADRMEALPAVDPIDTPAYLAAQAEREAAARRVRVEQTRAAPDVSVSLGVRRLAGDDATALVAGVSAPFLIFDRNRGAISASRAELTAAEARLGAARLDAQAEIASALSKAGAAQTRVAANRQAEATATEAYRLTRLGYEGGKLPLVEVLNARRVLIEARDQILNARLERLTAEAALARLQGVAPFGDHP
ncbi:outer membrane protein [Caulobacter sp. AP07]|uniref:TolC family protein n=1 Tax=Caulobacter sp. AP07 TaxID=1144304 RepID=UPI0002722523|nr:TolC family protein [Caulobacter sp. AP07]EJL33289.1 outer membrane protein [Caulobacter sp. AP07]